MAIERREIYRANLEPMIGGEQQGNARPCLILSITAFNKGRMFGVVPCPRPPSPSAVDRADPFSWKSVFGCLARAAPRDRQEAACRSTNGQTLEARSEAVERAVRRYFGL